jgi:uncharacterized membrane protein YphA (DoxX/SURF4 family)
MNGGLFFIRLAVAVIFMYHAIPKLKDPKGMAASFGWVPNQVLGLGIIEFMSALAILGGVSIKFASLALMVVMLGAMYHKIKKWKVHFMAANATGWEFDFLLFCANLTLYLKY